MNPRLWPALQPFLDKTTPPEEAIYHLFGAPLDETTSHRRGTRFAPNAIRQASIHLDSYSTRTRLDWDDLLLADLGDLKGMKVVEKALGDIESLVAEVRERGKVPVMVGGEHTITLGALRALKPEAVVVFDAHLDLRDTLFEMKLCHATYLRRAFEEQASRIVVIGARALSGEEVGYAEGNDLISFVTSHDLIKQGSEVGVDAVKGALDGVSSAYLSIDMDVLDPSQAPAVGNPSPEGITVTMLMDIINGIVDERFLGLDLDEVSPHYDSGLTATTAAYIILETLYSLEKTRRG